ncbi:MAG TPA: hypothetical protein VD995_04735 [Azospirillum sp.]|nr:hypothetical protein [Azospirillum sp.]
MSTSATADFERAMRDLFAPLKTSPNLSLPNSRTPKPALVTPAEIEGVCAVLLRILDGGGNSRTKHAWINQAATVLLLACTVGGIAPPADLVLIVARSPYPPTKDGKTNKSARIVEAFKKEVAEENGDLLFGWLALASCGRRLIALMRGEIDENCADNHLEIVFDVGEEDRRHRQFHGEPASTLSISRTLKISEGLVKRIRSQPGYEEKMAKDLANSWLRFLPPFEVIDPIDPMIAMDEEAPDPESDSLDIERRSYVTIIASDECDDAPPFERPSFTHGRK